MAEGYECSYPGEQVWHCQWIFQKVHEWQRNSFNELINLHN